MKKSLFLALVILLAAGSFTSINAQTDPSVKSEVNNIRAAYAKAKKEIAQNDAGTTRERSDMVVTSHYMVPSCGLCTETIHYYYTLKIDELTTQPYYLIYFITRKYNVAARQFYEEYLYEGEGPTLKFAFRQYDEIDGNKAEERFYFNYYGLIWKLAKNNIDPADEKVMQRESSRLESALNSLLNTPD